MGGIEKFRCILREALETALHDNLSVEHIDEFSSIGRKDIPQINERRVAWALSRTHNMKILGIEVAISKKGDPFHRYPLPDLLEYKGYSINRSELKRVANELWNKVRGVTKFDIVGRDTRTNKLCFVEVKTTSEIGTFSIDDVDENTLKRVIEKDDRLRLQFLRQQEFVNSIKVEVKPCLLYAVTELDEKNIKVTLYRASEVGINFSFLKSISSENKELRIEKYPILDNFFSAVREGLIPLCQGMRSIVYLIRMKLLQKETLEEKLEKIDRNELASWFEELFGYPLTGDNRRHDIEDQLERRGFVERAINRGAIYYITPAGWIRATYFETLIKQQKISIEELVENVEKEVRLLSKNIVKEIS